MSLSVVTITFNNFEELRKTLSSIENLNCERVVINGGTCKKTEDFLKGRPEIISLTEKDAGISDAFNKGIRISNSKGIWFLNSGDVCIDPNFITFAAENINHCSYIFSDIVLDSPLYGKLKVTPSQHRPLAFGMPYPHQGMVFHRDIFNQIGLFKLDYKIAMDFELLCRMRKRKLKGLYYSNAVALMDGTGISNIQQKKAHQEVGKALKENDMMSLINILSYFMVEYKLFIKDILGKTGLLKYYQSLKKLAR